VDINAAVGSRSGVPDEQIAALVEYPQSPLFSERERIALRIADGMTITGEDIDDELFGRALAEFGEDGLVELIALIALENFRSKANHALRIESQGFYEPSAGV
jgi:alkylhydroperoxidase family enzyme